MPSLKLSNLSRRSAATPTLRKRAADLQARISVSKPQAETPEPIPAAQIKREQSDAKLLALAPVWEAAVEFYEQRVNEERAICAAADEDGRPGADPGGSGPECGAWQESVQDWRERTGIAAAEDASGDAGTALYGIEVQISELPAASLAGLKLKARVAKRSEDIGIIWPHKLGEGLARDILAFSEAQATRPVPPASIVGQIDFASATMDELQAVHDVAERIGSLAYAYAWGARCRRGENKHGAPYFNAAGELVQWLGDALTAVETAVHEEARRRVPDGAFEREVRLQILAAPVTQNGDDDEVEAFARELLAHSVALREGR